MAETRFGTFDDLMADTDPVVRPVAERLRELVFEVDRESVEVVRLGDRAATYGVGPRKMTEGYAYVLPYRSWVNLGFYKGTDLADPESLLEGTGATMRHVKIRTVEDAELPAVRTLVASAASERRAALGR